MEIKRPEPGEEPEQITLDVKDENSGTTISIDTVISPRKMTYEETMLSREFSGHVYEGYLREGDPVGPKVEFTDDKIATYDFSDDLRHFQWGMQVGAGWRAFKHLNIYADLTWGLNDIFKNDFQTITFAMYPIYLNVGFGYAF